MWEYWNDLGDGFVGAIRLLLTGDAETWIIIRQTLFVSVSAAAASMVVGGPIAALLAYSSFRGRAFVLALCNTGFGLPPVVVGLVLSLLLLRHGPLGAL
jgi:tungstate transport system permease protein